MDTKEIVHGLHIGETDIDLIERLLRNDPTMRGIYHEKDKNYETLTIIRWHRPSQTFRMRALCPDYDWLAEKTVWRVDIGRLEIIEEALGRTMDGWKNGFHSLDALQFACEVNLPEFSLMTLDMVQHYIKHMTGHTLEKLFDQYYGNFHLIYHLPEGLIVPPEGWNGQSELTAEDLDLVV